MHLKRHIRLGVLLVALAVTIIYASGRSHNGFDLSGSLVPIDEIHLGGPAKDGIPALDQPLFVKADQASHVDRSDQVLGLVQNGIAKAYPISIMNWHEIVNDRFADLNIAVTYCPLCSTGVAFISTVNNENLTFGVSGLLYNSDVLLYDRQTESLWSQLMTKAISGPLKSSSLHTLPLTHTTWKAWRSEYPDTLVLSRNTGFKRDYGRDPYGSYAKDTDLYFPVNASSARYHPKERVLGVEIDGNFKAYPFAELSRHRTGTIDDLFVGKRLEIRFDHENESARAYDEGGRQLPAVTSFWFAWYAFHPETEVFTTE